MDTLQSLISKIKNKDASSGNIDPPLLATVVDREGHSHRNQFLVGVDLILLSWIKNEEGRIDFVAIPSTPPFYGGRGLIKASCVEYKE